MDYREPSSEEDTFYVCLKCNRWYREELDVCPEDDTKLKPTVRPTDSLVGEVLAERFHIDGFIGEGGAGTVYRAMQKPIGRPVAIKVLHRELIDDKNLVSRFLNEAQAASALVNPNTVTIHDFGQTPDGSLFIAMEYLEGLTLADKVARGPLEVRYALEIAAQVCRALSEAHRKGIVHRDLKPENIMLTVSDDRSLLVKVVDFGIAKVLRPVGLSEEGVPITQVGTVIGTPSYMSPEQARGGALGPASDLYALGVILFEMIAGSPPFKSSTLSGLVAAQMTEAPPALPSPLEPVDDTLVELVETLLAKSPDDRPQAAEDVRTTLTGLLEGVTTKASELIEVTGEDQDEELQDLLETSRFQARAVEATDVVVKPSVVGRNTAKETTLKTILRSPWRLPRRQALLLIAIGAAIGISLATWLSFILLSDGSEPGDGRVVIMDQGLIGTTRDGPIRETPNKAGVEDEAVNVDSCSVMLRSEPEGARVSHEGRLLCFTPCRADLPSGQVDLNFRKRGFLALTHRIVAEEGIVVSVELEPSPSVE